MKIAALIFKRPSSQESQGGAGALARVHALWINSPLVGRNFQLE